MGAREAVSGSAFDDLRRRGVMSHSLPWLSEQPTVTKRLACAKPNSGTLRGAIADRFHGRHNRPAAPFASARADAPT